MSERLVFCAICGEQLEPAIETPWRQGAHECRFIDQADRTQQILTAWDDERCVMRQALITALHDLTVPQHLQNYDTVPALRHALSTIAESVKR